MNCYKTIIAEDEELLLHHLVSKIEATNLGFQIVGRAQTGRQALELVKELSPDLLVTDIKMPVMSGLELLEQIHASYPAVKTIIISGFSDFSFARQALKYQVVEYLLKPIDPEELHAALWQIKTQLEQKSYDSITRLADSCSTPRQVAQILQEYILSNYDQDINLNLVANSMNYSPSYLTKVFYQIYDSSPLQYIISLRLQKAQQLLSHNPELSIRQIGELIGYPDQGYFSRIFKKHIGVSPYDYRDKNPG